ncbi:nucleotidyltransferase [Bombilactobacillus thymidiniphilus]|uniref:tRNA(Met) cytidine acetate ligase n=1 Tax=Bombilactobacillus thymidiniphilus TaxID=2923363 RepID=A0ABY4PCQ0_9LACO|nr:nucleotidyltransferase [Bombilactobacillus thymidiniphilus]UQS83370.1 nucleotidyltransferase [Bombilactobacillus thymidiniphilus]
MTIVGLVVEYNPFHNGHLWQIQQVKQKLHPECLVVVMSGNFVQRGEVALVDKWQRAQMALAAGVDLVIELPVYGALQPADLFAEEAVRLLRELQVTDLAFGTEKPALDYWKLGQQLNELTTEPALFKDYRNTYATQFNQLLQEQLGFMLTKPNELLGVAYAQAAGKLDYAVNLLPLPRIGGVQHDDPRLLPYFSSASAIRTAVLNNQNYATAVPPFVQQQLSNNALFNEQLFPYLKYRLLTANLSELSQIYQMSEGLQYKLQQEITNATDFQDFLYKIKSKRFTFARLRRLCLYTLLNITTEQMQEMRAKRYLHVLGFNARGRQQLHNIRQQVTLPVVTKVTQKMGQKNGLMAKEIQVDQMLQLLGVPEQNFGRQPIMRK